MNVVVAGMDPATCAATVAANLAALLLDPRKKKKLAASFSSARNIRLLLERSRTSQTQERHTARAGAGPLDGS